MNIFTKNSIINVPPNSKIRKIKLFNGDTSIMKNNEQIGLICKNGNEYWYSGIYKNLNIGEKASVPNLNVKNWELRSICVFDCNKRSVVTLVDPNDDENSVSAEIKDVIQ